MKTIFKYVLQLGEHNIVQGCESFRPVHVAVQDGQLCVWAELDTAADPQNHRFAVIGTGHPAPVPGEYVGSVLSGMFVWHVYWL